jgi:hypothetical protein
VGQTKAGEQRCCHDDKVFHLECERFWGEDGVNAKPMGDWFN